MCFSDLTNWLSGLRESLTTPRIAGALHLGFHSLLGAAKYSE